VVVIYHPKKAEANPAKTPNAPVVTVRVVSHPNPPKRPSNVVLQDTVGLHVRVASRFFPIKIGCSRTIFPVYTGKIDSSNNFSYEKIEIFLLIPSKW